MKQGLRANKTSLLDKCIKIHFQRYGGSYGKVIENNVIKDLYKLDLAVDGEVQFTTFQDVLSVLPRSCFGKQARAHQARIIHSLATACYLGIGNTPIQVASFYPKSLRSPTITRWSPCMSRRYAIVRGTKKKKDAITLNVFRPPPLIVLFGLF